MEIISMTVFFYARIVLPLEGMAFETLNNAYLTTRKMPASINQSSWFRNLINDISKYYAFDALCPDGYFKIPFTSLIECEDWIKSHALSDPDLINDAIAHNTRYGISYINEIHYDDGTIVPTTLSLIPLP
jgi:hypothetical protein